MPPLKVGWRRKYSPTFVPDRSRKVRSDGTKFTKPPMNKRRKRRKR